MECETGWAHTCTCMHAHIHTRMQVLLMECETGWAQLLHSMSDERVVEAVMVELRKMFKHATDPTSYVVARLGDNPFQRGMYMWMHKHTCIQPMPSLASATIPSSEVCPHPHPPSIP